MPRHPTPLPDPLLETSFSLIRSDQLDVSRKRTLGRDLMAPSRGLRLPTGPDLPASALLRGYSELDERLVLVDYSAAEIWNAPLPLWPPRDGEVRLARPRGDSKPRRKQVGGRKLSFAAGEVLMHDGVRVTSPARTFLDLAEFLQLEDLVAAGDHLVNAHDEHHPRPRQALCTVAELRRTVVAHPGKRGVRTARLALDLVRVGADSAQETFLRLTLAEHGLPDPVLNHSLSLPWRGRCVWPDVAYPDWKLSLQYDGAVHDGQSQYVRDFERQRLTEEAGWTEVRIGKGDLKGRRPFAVVRVREALAKAGWPGSGTRENS
ncbi:MULTISPECIES: hypothetical protein [Arthrobacter]|uniref:DUF559 domain-containing protein n=2 Tax=Arthrobacter TaxID=1663 RepID=A0ABU9KLC4_9MICC|nr:hypothetical protein [Arthrobacter sp. YJM1]MDP5227648.1 hypothetical protein [Arthrobacter sp. YJM1]